MSTRRVHGAARVAAGLLLSTVLGLGLWQCAEDSPVRSAPSGLELALSRAQGVAALVDTVQIELRRDGVPEDADTAAVSGGAFSVTLVAPVGEGYEVRVYGLGPGSGLEPEETTRGVTAYGAADGLTLRPGQVTRAEVHLAEAAAQILSVQGAPGYDTLRVVWTAVDGATGYTLGWHAGEPGTAGSLTGILDTLVTLTWEDAGAVLDLVAQSDSAYFRVRPEFGQRAGVFGTDQLIDLTAWMSLPRLTAIFPGNEGLVEHDTASVWLGFDRPMELATLATGVVWHRLGGGGAVKHTVERLEPGGSRYRLVPNAGELDYGQQYEVIITSTATDTLGHGFDAAPDVPGLQSAVVRWSTKAYDPLRVLAVHPEAGAADVAVTDTVRLALNRAIDLATLADTTCYLTDPMGVRQPGLVSAVATADTILWRPSPALWFGTTYTIHVATGLTDLRGRPLDMDPQTLPELEAFASPFVTTAQPVGPAVLAVDPADGARAVALSGRVRVTFSEPVDVATVHSPETFKLLQNGIAARAGVVTSDAEQRVFTFTPNTRLDLSTRYVVVVTSGVTSLSGVRLDQDRGQAGYDDFRAEFTTEGPLRVVASTPAAGATRVAVDRPLELTFSAELDPSTVTAGTVQLLHGSLSIDCGRTLAADRLHLTITPDGALAWLTQYHLKVDTLVTAADGSRLDQDATLPGRQPFLLQFATEPESINPRIVLVSPAADSVDVEIDVVPRVTFSEPVDPATVRANTLYLSRILGSQQSEAVPGETGVSYDSLEAVFVPQTELLNGETYELRATSLITSRYGFRLDQTPETPGHQDFASRFRTVPERIAPRVSDTSPRSGTLDVPVTTAVQVLFSEPMDGGSLVAAFSLADAAEAISGAGELDPAGEVWTFTPDTPLDWSTTYTARVDTTALDLAGNRLDQSSSQPGRQAFSAFFVTAADSVPPQALSMDPPDGSTGAGVDPTDTLRVTFSEPLALASLTASSFRLEAPGGAAVGGTAALEEDGRVVAWVPADSLAFATTYTVVADTLLTDVPGNGLDQDPNTPGRQPFIGSFTTKGETVPPRVVQSDPAAGETGVAAGVTLTVTFTEPMDAGDLPAAFHLWSDGVAVAGDGELGSGGTSWSFAPGAPLAYGAACTLQVDTTATDVAGNLLDQDRQAPYRQPYIAGFTVEDDTYPPRVVAMDPDSGSLTVAITDTLRLTFSEPLLPSSVTAAAVRVVVTGGGTVAGDLWLEQGGTVVAWAPVAPLAHDTAYGMIADTLLVDAAGNRLDQDDALAGRQPFVGPFRTATEQDPPSVAVSDPADGEIDVALDAVVTVEFSEPMNAATVAAAFALRRGETPLAGSGTLGGGGLIWSFVPEDSLERSRTYELVVDTTAVDLAGNRLDQDPLLAGRQAWRAEFTTMLDIVPPAVTAIVPAPGEDSVTVHLDLVRVTFSERLDPASVTGEGLWVAPVGGEPMAATLALLAGDREILWMPAGSLEFSTRYEVTADTTLTDRAGNLLDQDPVAPGRQPYVAFFITMPETIPPMVTGVAPNAPWPVDVQPTLLFSEPMDSLSLQAAGVVKLMTGGLVELPITLSFTPAADSMTVIPAGLLDPSSSFFLYVGTAATDTLGNALDQDPATPQGDPYLQSFTTE